MRLLLSSLFLLLLLGCGADVQTSSGSEYLAARPDYRPASGTDLDRAVERAANVEPLLRFPARFGLARISGGRHVPVPPREADAWIAFAAAHPDYGSFVPISPVISEMTVASLDLPGAWNNNPIVAIRLAAARQHVDAVLVYTVGGTREDQASPLSLLDLTIIGAYLVPSRGVAGTAIASGLLFDVRNGYPYVTLTTNATDRGFVPAVGSTARSADLLVDAQVDAVAKLAGEAGRALTSLRTQLQQKAAPTGS
jgi:hypothetical protein